MPDFVRIIVLLGLGWLGVLTSAASAAPPPIGVVETEEATDPPPPKPGLEEGQLNELRENPASVLEKFPQGGPQMASYVSDAVIADPTLAKSMVEVAAEATPPQASAMGAGLARAARYYSTVNPEISRQISKEVMESANPRMKITFRAIGPGFQPIDTRPIPAPVAVGNAPSGPRLGSRVPPSVGNRGVNPRNGVSLPEDRDNRRGGGGASGELFTPNDAITTIVAEDAADDDDPVTTFVSSDAEDNDTESTSPTQ